MKGPGAAGLGFVCGKAGASLDGHRLRVRRRRRRQIENIMVARDGHLKLIDLGLCRHLPLGEFSLVDPHRVGSVIYMSRVRASVESTGPRPRIRPRARATCVCLLGLVVCCRQEQVLQGQVGFFTDWWAVGVLAHELMTGCSPWTTLEDRAQLEHQITTVPVSPPGALSQDAADLLRELMNHSVQDRLGSDRGIAEVRHGRSQKGGWGRVAM